MRSPFELFIARRYLKARRKTGFINYITYISIMGVTIGVAALIIVLSVMNGFESEVRQRIIGVDAHIRIRTFHDRGIEDYQKLLPDLQDLPHITGISPYIMDKGMLKAGQYSGGVMVRGADPLSLREVSDLADNIVYGDLNLGLMPQADGKKLPGIVVGKYLADELMLDVGQRVVLMSLAGVTGMFSMPPMKEFVVAGFFESGFFEFDNTYLYISISAAQELFRMPGRVSGLEVKLDDINKAGEVRDAISDQLDYRYYPRTWFELRQNLFSWMQLEKWAMFIVLSLIILVAAFNIISTLIMVVMEKTREIGIFKSMGATDGTITRIFLYEGVVVGVVGTILGFLIGFGLCWAQQTYEFFSLPGDVYFINALPIKMRTLDFLAIGVASLLICLVSAIYPARRASKLDPVEAIRYE